MRILAPLFAILALGFAPVRGRALAADAADAAGSEVRYRPHALVIQLRPEAARTAARIPVAARPEATGIERLGLAGLDRIAADLGGAWFEREFPDAPGPGLHGDGAAPPGPDLAAFYIARLPPGTDRDRALDAIRRAPEVERADPIAIVPVVAIPDDSLWTSAYYFDQPSGHHMSAVAAWDLCRGDSAVSVGILDTGVLLHHPDLRDRIRIHWPERGGMPGVDDDGNGYVDDDQGWDFVALDSASLVVRGEDWRDEDNDPDDYVAHGTAVAGLVAARTNNRIGIASVAWDARILPLRVGWSASTRPSGEIDLSYVAQAMVYAARLGAQVLNCSFTSVPQADLAAAANFATRAGVTIVAAAGNGQPEHYLPDREDVIAVAATDPLDQLALFSNRGSYVDVAAAGVTVATTSITRPGTDSLGYRQPTYSTTASGTSFAAPLVAGAVALIQSQRRQQGLPPLHPLEAQMRLSETADDIAAQNPGVSGWGSGRVNLWRALTDPPTSFVIPSSAATVGPGVVMTSFSGATWLYFARSDGNLLRVAAASGATPRLFPLPGPPLGGLAAADLGGGRGNGLFVVVPTGSADAFAIAGLDPLGRALPGWPVVAGGHRGGADPALGDLDGDGTLEVVLGDRDGRVWAWHGDGTLLQGFPRAIEGAQREVRVALSDLDGVPGVEILAAVEGGGVYAVRADGTILPRWGTYLYPAEKDPLIARMGLGPDTVMVVVPAAGGRLMALRSDGRLAWQRSPNAVLPPVAGDLDGDGSDEIVVVRELQTGITVLDSLGATRASFRVSGFVSTPFPAPPLVAALVPGGRPGILHVRPSSTLVAFDGEGALVEPFPFPGGAGISATVFDLDGDGRSEVAAGSGSDSSIYVYDAGPSTWNPAAQPWPTARANFARTGSRLYAPPLARLDDVPPEPVADLSTGAIGVRSVELRWTIPADVGESGRPSRYELRRAPEPLDEAGFGAAEPVDGVPLPGAPGAAERVEVTGLEESTSYFFAIRSIDAGGNASPIAQVAARTAAVRPDPVRDVRVESWTDTSVTLRWIATGEDGSIGRPARYQLAASQQAFDEAGFDAAPIRAEVKASTDAGRWESVTLGRLVRGRRYWVAVRAADAHGNRSALSSLLSTWVGPLAARSGVALASGVQPSRSPVDLYWQDPGSSADGREIGIYDLGGRRVRRFALAAGTEGVERWDGRDHEGHAVPAGVYFASLTGGAADTRARIVLIR